MEKFEPEKRKPDFEILKTPEISIREEREAQLLSFNRVQNQKSNYAHNFAII